MIHSWLDFITTRDPICRNWQFDRVTVSEAGKGASFCLLAPVWSEYTSGPSLIHLASVAYELTGRPGNYGYLGGRALNQPWLKSDTEYRPDCNTSIATVCTHGRDPKPSFHLPSGRTVLRFPMCNGATQIQMAEGPDMTEAEWQEYCSIISKPPAKKAKAKVRL